MDIGVPWRVLGKVDAAPAIALVGRLGEADWALNRFRQEVLAGHPHRQATRAILLKYNFDPAGNPWSSGSLAEAVAAWCHHVGIDPAPIRPAVEAETLFGKVNVFPQWHAMRDVIEPLVDQALAPIRTEDGLVTRIALVELAPGGRIAPHTDDQLAANWMHRIHVPLVSPPGVQYRIDGRRLVMKVGRAYDFNNRKTHSVANRSTRPRVNLLVDYLPRPDIPVAAAPGG